MQQAIAEVTGSASANGAGTAPLPLPICLIPSEFSHLSLLFKSKHTLLFKARRRVGIASPPPVPTPPHPPHINVTSDAELAAVAAHAAAALAATFAASSHSPPNKPRATPAENEEDRYESVVLKMPNLFTISESAGRVDEAGVAGKLAAVTPLPLASPIVSSLLSAPSSLLPQHFTPLQSGRIKQFLQQYVIAKTLQSKNVQGLVQLRKLTSPSRAHNAHAHWRCARGTRFDVTHTTVDARTDTRQT